MKKIIFIASLVMIGFGAVAQDSGKNHRTDTSGTTDQVNDYYTMQAGKVVLMHGMKAMPLISSFKLKNGSILQTDGIVLTSDGQQHQLKDGERLYINGKIAGRSNPDTTNKKDSTL